MNLHATHPAAFDPDCGVCRTAYPIRGADAMASWLNPDPLRAPATDEPWADADADDVLVVWIGAVLLLVALLVGVGVGVVTACGARIYQAVTRQGRPDWVCPDCEEEPLD